MQIDVMPTKNTQGWVVVAHTESGDCHDFFATKEAALDFALRFYGGRVVPIKRIPKTTEAKLRHYCTTRNSCQCQDRRNGGGSYLDPRGSRICKHIHAVRMEDFRLANMVADTWVKLQLIDQEGTLTA
jgi:hypothetical protein